MKKFKVKYKGKPKAKGRAILPTEIRVSHDLPEKVIQLLRKYGEEI